MILTTRTPKAGPQLLGACHAWKRGDIRAAQKREQVCRCKPTDHVYAYIYIVYIYTHTFVYVHIYICTYLYMYISLYVYIYTHTHLCLYLLVFSILWAFPGGASSSDKQAGELKPLTCRIPRKTAGWKNALSPLTGDLSVLSCTSCARSLIGSFHKSGALL